MSFIKKQLREFYAKTQPDLSNKQRRSAMRYDLKAVKRNRNHSRDCELDAAFLWGSTPEGATYWLRRSSGDAHAVW